MSEPRNTRLRFTIHLRDLPNNNAVIAVSAQLNGQPLVPEQTVTPGPNFAFSYADFLHAHPTIARQSSSDGHAAYKHAELLKLGDAVGRVVFPAAIDTELSTRLVSAPTTQELELVFTSPNARLLSIPFEAARLASGRIPSLMPGVFTWRTPTSTTQQNRPSSTAPSPGPLKILVAIGAPYEANTDNAVLDIERELHTILNSLQEARNNGSAYVRVLETGSPDQIAAALHERTYHVLHLSGHGKKGFLELEDEDGNPVLVPPARLAERIHDSGHTPPLIVLASCLSGLGDSQTTSFAQGLINEGIPAVLAMQTSVSDEYATTLAGKFYASLSSAQDTLASRALALARRQIEQNRENPQVPLSPAAKIPEYATPSLFLLAAEEQPILDRTAPPVPVVTPARLAASGTVPLLQEDDLIGRRREAREIIRVLTDDPKAIAQFGRKAGCQILGTGGVGKSSIAGRIMQRMAERGWLIATPRSWGLDNIASSLSATLWDHTDQALAKLAQNLAKPAPDPVRLNWLTGLLARYHVLLVLDNFEDLLTPAGAAFKDDVTAQIFSLLLESCQRAKLLITSRYPVPNTEAHLHRVNLGPLSTAETRKLILRHEALNREPTENLKLIERAIGGHPRTLEYLDALLRNGTAKLSAVQARLTQFAAQEGISLTGTAPFEDRLRDAIRIATADAMVAELVRVISQNPADLQLLWQSSVFPFPVPAAALAFDPANPKAAIDSSPLAQPIRRLAASSLLTPLDDEHIFVHRWTAESLKSQMHAEAYQACCLHSAQYLKFRPAADLNQFIGDLTEAVHLFLSAQAFDEAASSTSQLIRKLKPLGQTILWTELSREVSTSLPPAHDDKSRLLRQESDGLRILGFGPQALDCCQKALHLDEQKVQQEPGRADYLRDLSVSYERMGDLQRALGDGDAARQFFQKSLDIAERLVQQEPGRADYLRDLYVSYIKMGDLQRDLGDGDAARQFFQKSLDIAERLVQQEPGRADYLRDLYVSYIKMGDLQRDLGDGDAARQFFQKSLDIAERLVQQEPGRADYLRDLSVSYIKMGDLQSALGDGDAARQFFKKSLAIRERLVQQEPGRADYLRDLSVSYIKMGDLQSALGDGDAARQFFQKSLDIRDRLVQQEPGRADYLRDLAVSYERLGDLQRALGDGDAARQFFKKSLAIRERLVQQEPGRADYLRDLSVSYERMGDLQSALGDGDAARQFFQKSLDIAERLVQQEPGRADYLRDLSVSYIKMGDLQSALGDGDAARQFFKKSLAIRERLVQQEPGRADYAFDVVSSLFRLDTAQNLERALSILLDLKRTNRLNKTDERWIAEAQQRLQQAKSAGA